MDVNVAEINGIVLIASAKEVRHITRNVVAEGRREVVSFLNLFAHFNVRDVSTISGEDAYDAKKPISVSRSVITRVQHIPWFAIAFNAGQHDLLSVSFGGMNSGHFPPKPGQPWRVTLPTFLLNEKRLRTTSALSQAKR